MKSSSIILVLAFTVMTIVPALAQDTQPADDGCPTIGLGIEGTVQAVERAPSCTQAFRLMNQCSGGGLSDGPVGAAVRHKCEGLFLPRLNAAGRQTYQRELKRCLDKYANQRGSLYGSLTAFCQTGNAVRRAARYEKRG
jgi:hypothetical protein